MIWLLFAVLAVAMDAAAQPAPARTVVATTQHFELHSDPWINLHHFLYQWARQDQGLGGGRKPVTVPERASLPQMPAAARADWLRALAFYREAIASRSHWDLDMLRLKRELVNLSGDATARPPDRINGIADALSTAMPIYLDRWWPRHDEANRAWIDEVAPRARRHERGFVALTMRVHGAMWPLDRWRVDASAYANGIAGYTTREGHVVVYSTDTGIQDLFALEMIFHEIQHASVIEGSTPAAVETAFAAVGAQAPDNLSHALIFATAGEFVRSIAAGEGRPRYQPYWINEGFETLEGWSHLVPAINQYWLPGSRGDVERRRTEIARRSLPAVTCPPAARLNAAPHVPISRGWLIISGPMAIEAVNPATGETLKIYDEMTPQQTAAAVADAHAAWKTWRKTPFAERARPMKKAAVILRERKDEFAKLMALEMGKPFKQGIAEAEKCALGCDYYADHAEAHLAPEMVKTEAVKSYVAFEPLGVVLAVMPWNFPFWQVFRFAAPALMAGNAGVLKHASNVPGCALAIEEVFVQAGFPKGVFRTLLIGSRQVKAVIENPHVSAVTLTGSTPAGKAVAAQAGAALKKTVLELGGSDPYIVLEDADLDYAVNTCATSRLINSGQSCVNAKRFIIVEPLVAAFTEKLVAAMKSRRMGDPLAEGTDVGPQSRPDLRDELHKQVMDSVAKGATLLLGGEIPPGKGSFYPPTVLGDVKKGMPAYDEELFGPVASVFSARDEGDAVRIANDSIFGLGAAVFTSDVARGERVARELEAGCTFVNTLVASDPRLPFGGIKESGYGRELGTYGIKEFVNLKTVYVK